jgi:hypothetical protein
MTKKNRVDRNSGSPACSPPCSADGSACKWGPHVTLREPTFNVAFGSYERCVTCGWIAYEDWTAMRATSVRSLHPPDSIKD